MTAGGSGHSTLSRPWLTVVATLGAALVCGVGLVVYQLWTGSRLPLDSPIPMMYRTEAQMQSLITATEKYYKTYGEYPSSGIEGQRAAVDALNATVEYLAELPRDAWGRYFVYIRAADYDVESWGAMRNAGDGSFYNPDTYQIYSLGMDGTASHDGASGSPDEVNSDNINNWDHSRSWRETYEQRQREYNRRADR